MQFSQPVHRNLSAYDDIAEKRHLQCQHIELKILN